MGSIGSVVGDKLEGHEILQHANLKANGLATERLSTEASKNNPVIAVERSTHKEINKTNEPLAAKQSPEENIRANAEIYVKRVFQKRMLMILLESIETC